ncbi:hypothetical protein EV368DRAFT_69119 [Lentinula lateritia]|nr:hypothetical protein EV368DRAFT_69119 [Lentinula lateritia]
MSTSRTTTQTTSDIGSILVTAGTGNQPPAPARLMTPSVSDEERELESQLARNRERLQQLKEKRQAEEAARRKAEVSQSVNDGVTKWGSGAEQLSKWSKRSN